MHAVSESVDFLPAESCMWQDRKNVNTALQCRYFDALHARLRPHPRALTDVHVVVENY